MGLIDMYKEVGMDNTDCSEKLLGVLRRHNAEVNSIVEDWRKSQQVRCKDQEVRIEGFNDGDVVIKFKKDNSPGNNHTHVEIWTKGKYRGYFHIAERKFYFFKRDDDFKTEVCN